MYDSSNIPLFFALFFILVISFASGISAASVIYLSWDLTEERQDIQQGLTKSHLSSEVQAFVPKIEIQNLRADELALIKEETSIPLKVTRTAIEDFQTKDVSEKLDENKKAELRITSDEEGPLTLWSDSAGFKLNVENHGDINDIVDVFAETEEGEQLIVEPENFNLNPGGSQVIKVSTRGTETLTRDTKIIVTAKSLTSETEKIVEVERITESLVKMKDSGLEDACGTFALYS
ncbi:MAG: hypothetical protein ABH950_05555 [Candidatus Altiarchaeota archaeon]